MVLSRVSGLWRGVVISGWVLRAEGEDEDGDGDGIEMHACVRAWTVSYLAGKAQRRIYPPGPVFVGD